MNNQTCPRCGYGLNADVVNHELKSTDHRRHWVITEVPSGHCSRCEHVVIQASVLKRIRVLKMEFEQSDIDFREIRFDDLQDGGEV